MKKEENSMYNSTTNSLNSDELLNKPKIEYIDAKPS